MKKIIKAIVPKKYHYSLREIKYGLTGGYSTKSYSQEGEDMILQSFFGDKSKGFYVDVGACHPMRFSNTYIFYKRGWRGINIDATPGSMRLFNKFRKRDLNLEQAISNSSQNMTYYIFNERALNTFCKDFVEKRLDSGIYNLVDSVNMTPRTLREVLDEYLPSDCEIDFLSIDVEGLDFEVLMSNDWKKYRPTMVLVEQLKTPLHELSKDKTVQFMRGNGYLLYAKTIRTVFYLDSRRRLDVSGS